jgi:hypothetical protein
MSIRKFALPVFCVGLLAVCLVAQNPAPANPQDQPATPAATDQSQPQTPPASTTDQDKSKDQATSKDQSSTSSATKDQTSTTDDANKSNLPKTASEMPLLAALGSSAFGLATMLRAWRKRRG